MEVARGSLVHGRYRAEEQLGEGGQGSVYRVVDVADGSVKALKLIDVGDRRTDAAERAFREATAMAGDEHPALVPCRNYFGDPVAGIVGLVFDFVDGQRLSAAARDPRMSAAHRDAALEQLADALAHVHSRGVVHRDLKPANILVTRSFWDAPRAPGGVRLVDFGIAAPTGNPRPLTAIPGMIGTAPYMAPEIFVYGPSSTLRDGFARDVFAFGVLGWELMTGSHPSGLPLDRSGKDYLDAYHAANAAGRWPPGGAGGAWATILQACLELDPQRRPADGRALAEGHRAALTRTAAAHGSFAGAPSRAHPPSAPRSPTYATALTAGYAPPTAQPPWAPPPEMLAPMPSFAERSRPAASRSRTAWISVVVALLVLVVGAGAMIALVRSRADDAPGAPASVPPPPVSRPGASPAGITPRVTPGATPAPGSGLEVPCNADGSACTSERVCRRDVVKKGLVERAWRVRVNGVGRWDGVRLTDLSQTNPDAQLCWSVNGAAAGETCVRLRDAGATGGDRAHRLEAHTSDIERGALSFRLDGVDASEVRGSVAATPEHFMSSALCQGARLFLGSKRGPGFAVLAFLDDD